VLEQAAGQGQALASSLNIAAFNLGNALGAWLGGVVVDRGPGLPALGYVAALLSLTGLGVALWTRHADAPKPGHPSAACAASAGA